MKYYKFQDSLNEVIWLVGNKWGLKQIVKDVIARLAAPLVDDIPF